MNHKSNSQFAIRNSQLNSDKHSGVFTYLEIQGFFLYETLPRTRHLRARFWTFTFLIKTCRDPDDNKFLELAKDANAEFLITGDQDLLSLKALAEYQNQIITPKDFLAID